VQAKAASIRAANETMAGRKSWQVVDRGNERDRVHRHHTGACPLQKFGVPLVARGHSLVIMSSRKFQPSSIKNKIKREDEARKAKRIKRQDKLQRRLALAKEEANDPAAKKVRQSVILLLQPGLIV
jgi:hypothetical protein